GEVPGALGRAVAEDGDWLQRTNETHMTGNRRECKSVLLALLLMLQATTTRGQTDDIGVIGLSQGKAVVTVGSNPRPRVLRDGDSLPNGARLLKATPDSAVFEIDGQHRTLTMGNRVSATAPSSGNGQVILTADERGHFVTMGTINGGTVQ